MAIEKYAHFQDITPKEIFYDNLWKGACAVLVLGLIAGTIYASIKAHGARFSSVYQWNPLTKKWEWMMVNKYTAFGVNCTYAAIGTALGAALFSISLICMVLGHADERTWDNNATRQEGMNLRCPPNADDLKFYTEYTTAKGKAFFNVVRNILFLDRTNYCYSSQRIIRLGMEARAGRFDDKWEQAKAFFDEDTQKIHAIMLEMEKVIPPVQPCDYKPPGQRSTLDQTSNKAFEQYDVARETYNGQIQEFEQQLYGTRKDDPPRDINESQEGEGLLFKWAKKHIQTFGVAGQSLQELAPGRYDKPEE